MKRAFSLIELTIVLIIIGIILSLVVKGTSVIKSAKIKRDYNNYILRLKDDIYKYQDKMLSLRGYAAILGDGKENGGFEDITDGFVDTDNQSIKNSTVATLLNSNLNTTIHVLTDYNGKETPYKLGTNHIVDYIKLVDKDIDKIFRFGNGKEGFIYTSTLGNKIHIYLGADREDEEVGNLLIIYNPSLEEAISYDTITDGQMDGEEGDMILLGYKYDSNSCTPKTNNNCIYKSGTCISKGIEKGCPFPGCSKESVSEIILGLKIK